MKRILYIASILILLVLTSCEKIIFSDQGDKIQQKTSFAEISQITVNDIFEIELKSDSFYSIEIETFERFIDDISSSLDSGNLTIFDDNQLKWLADYPRPKVIITFPALAKNIVLNAPVNMYSLDTVKIQKLAIVHIGKTGEIELLIDTEQFQFALGSDNSGIYSIRGKAGYAKIWPRGSGVVDASELLTDSSYVYNNSIGDCKINVKEKLEVRMNTLGNIIYYGSPEQIVILEESGSGRLLKAQ